VGRRGGVDMKGGHLADRRGREREVDREGEGRESAVTKGGQSEEVESGP